MTNICTLAPDINNCPHYDAEEGICIDGPKVCGFYQKYEEECTESKYIRVPRWYKEEIG